MFLNRVLLLLIVASYWSVPAVAQRTAAGYASVSGRVIDLDTRRPLTDAHVFIASSMIGAVTDDRGRFRLPRVPAGAHTLYVSMLGYAPARVDTLFNSGGTYRIALALHQTVIEGPEVTVTAERDRAWYRSLDKFTRLFVGESPNASHCEIENPEVLSFETRWWGKLAARARAPLVITNRALGYRITYFLEEFEAAGGTIRYDGEPLFEALPPPDSAMAAEWREARQRAYAGSFRHFMLSLLRNSYRDEGFRVYRRYSLDRTPYGGSGQFGFNVDRIFEEAPSSEEVRILDFFGYIEVVYEREPADASYLRWRYGSAWHSRREQQSLLKLTDGPARIDARGEILEPYGVTVYGHFAYERIADLVPIEYEP